ncbi:hypothetical protein [Rhodococcus sp. B10]|uniref:hypothetical protein n=1 Tax=Rhodococcus sp. B10 TaxID=2695876 RepID=UPI001431905E|nr:hypothetical protein [Rhodococcus sp. B10]NIL74758.1 hypothetical protein [Rhodococcus sp. B10]
MTLPARPVIPAQVRRSTRVRTPAPAETVQTERRGRWSITLLLPAAAIVVAIPVDFVTVGSFWRYLGLVGLLVGSAAAVWAIRRAETTIVVPALLFGFLVLTFNQVMNFNPVGYVTLLAPIVVGAGLAVALRQPLVALVVLSVALAVTMGVEYLVQQHVFGELFGDPHYIAYSRDTFRSRGLIGQAVPAGMVAVGVGAAALVLSSSTQSRRTAVRWVVVLSTAVSVSTSGTRSAVLCAAAVAVLTVATVATTAYRRRQGQLAVGYRTAWLGPLLLAAAVTVVVLYWSALAGQRVFDFGGLTGSASLDNRNYAAIVFDEWSDTCSGACVVFGSGARSLLDALGSGLGIQGFTTVDNLFLSLLWDFGVVTVLGIVALAVIAIRALLRSDSTRVRAGAVLILAIVLSGFFYDALYIRPVLLLCGFGIGLLGFDKKDVSS